MTEPVRYWLLIGRVPSGPFTVPEVHARLAAQGATWETLACPVGGSTWLPLVRTPGIGTVAGPLASDPPGPTPAEVATPHARPAATAGAPPSTAPPPLSLSDRYTVSTAPTPAPGETERKRGCVTRVASVGLVVAAFLGAAYGVYERVRPLTATEVCMKLDAAGTAAEAKPYATARMHPLLDALFADTSDPNDTSEWTQEIDGPRPATKLVGFRGTTFVPEAGRRVRVEGHFLVVKAAGWKVDDAVLTVVEGAALPGPVSLVEECAPPTTALVACRQLNSARSAAEVKRYATARMYPLVEALAADKSSPDPNDVFEITQEVDGGEAGTRKVGFRGSWYDQEAARRLAVEGHFRVVSPGGWKVDDMVLTGVEGAALPQPMSLVEEHRRSAPPAPDPLSQTRKTLPQLGRSPAVRPSYPAPRPWYEHLMDKYGWGGLVLLALLIAGRIAQVVFSESAQRPAAK